jgi:hypothetical protein
MLDALDVKKGEINEERQMQRGKNVWCSFEV